MVRIGGGELSTESESPCYSSGPLRKWFGTPLILAFRGYEPVLKSCQQPYDFANSTGAVVIFHNSQLKVDSLLVRFSAVTWICILVGTVVPAMVAAQHHVFYKTDIEKRIVTQHVQPAANIQSQKDVLNARIEALNLSISEDLMTAKDSAEVKNLVSLRHDIRDELTRLNEQIVVAPFFLNDLMFAWSSMYIALATLLFILLPKMDGPPLTMSWKIALTVGAVYPLYQGPVWLRNFVLSNEQRRVYSFANYDICPASFWMQEVNTLIWLLLIAFLWHRWFLMYKQRRHELLRNFDTPPDVKSLTQLSDTFLHWQVSSVVLGLGFMVFTGVFWGLVIVNKDRRYLFPAIVVHVVWALSWMLATLPLFATWRDFSRKKIRVTLRGSQGDAGGPGVAADPEVLEKLSPIAHWNGFGSAFAALLSFVFPIIHALIK